MKIYLSRATTRAMMADYPIGDPTGGPAYGEKRDPISAAVSLYTMFSAAEAGFAAMTLMQGISFAGAAISLIGNITGNKTLSSIGMIAGIAGGIGAFAESKGLFDSGNLADTLGFNKGSNVDLSSVFADAPGSLAPVVDGQQVPGSASFMNAEAATVPGALNAPAVDVNTAPMLETPANAPAPAGSNLTRNLGPAAAAPTSGLMQPADYSLMSNGPGTGLRLPNATGVPAKPNIMTLLKEGKFGDAAMTAGGKAMDFASSSPYGAYVAAQAIGAGAEYLSGLSDAKLEELRASSGYANARTLQLQTDMDREKAKRANLNESYNNVNAGFKVNPNAVVGQRPPGLVANAMQPRQG